MLSLVLSKLPDWLNTIGHAQDPGCLDIESSQQTDYATARRHQSPNAHCFTARAPRNLQRFGITHVVSAIQADVSKHFDRRILVMHVPIKGIPNAELLAWFDRVVELIARALDGNENHKVLVCHQVRSITRIEVLARYTALNTAESKRTENQRQ